MPARAAARALRRRNRQRRNEQRRQRFEAQIASRDQQRAAAAREREAASRIAPRVDQAQRSRPTPIQRAKVQQRSEREYVRRRRERRQQQIDTRADAVRVINEPNRKQRKAKWDKLTPDEKRRLGEMYDSGHWEEWDPNAETEPATRQDLEDTLRSYGV